MHPVHSLFAPTSFPAMDRATPKTKREAFARAKSIEEAYARKLRKVAAHVGDIVSGFDPSRWESADAIGMMLRQYADTVLRPWARSVAERMIADVNARDKKEWFAASRKMGREIRRQIDDTTVGSVIRARLAEQVDLIASLPREAAERVHKLTLEGITQGTRPAEIAAEILRTGAVTKSRATLIARTEVGRTATELTRARALSIGSTHYVWVSARDNDVRPDHKELDGKVFAWAEASRARVGGAYFSAHRGLDVTASPSRRAYTLPPDA